MLMGSLSLFSWARRVGAVVFGAEHIFVFIKVHVNYEFSTIQLDNPTIAGFLMLLKMCFQFERERATGAYKRSVSRVY